MKHPVRLCSIVLIMLYSSQSGAVVIGMKNDTLHDSLNHYWNYDNNCRTFVSAMLCHESLFHKGQYPSHALPPSLMFLWGMSFMGIGELWKRGFR